MFFCFVLAFLAFAEAQDCYSGENFAGGTENNGFALGPSVFLDYSTSEVSQGASSESVLTLVFKVPTRYVETDSVALTFHDEDELGSGVEASCFTTNSGYADCPAVDTSMWSSAASSGDACITDVTGALNFNDLLLNGHHDDEYIYVDQQDRVLASTGVLTPTWELYMIAQVETWTGFTAQSDQSGAGNLDTSQVVGNGLDDYHLNITDTLYQSYHIPFVISWPQEIQLDTEQGNVGPVVSVSQMVTLTGIIEQTILPISFTTSSAFANAELTVSTQVQFPFVLRANDDATAPAVLTATDGGNWASIDWNGYTGDCSSNSEGDMCVQTWDFLIVPTGCDVTGSFSLEFWAECQNTSDCPLETNFETTSNTYTGVLDFSVATQHFCPEILDDISVSGTITKYVNEDFSTEVDDSNTVYANDFVYIKTDFSTSTMQTDGSETPDDSLIDFVRVYSIDLAVTMGNEPLQFQVDTTGTDVTVTNTLEYSVNMCSADPFNPLTDTTATSCYDDTANNVAQTYMDFAEITTGCEADEVCFKYRLDDRVIPTDLLNTPVEIDITLLVEVYYVGVEGNPTVRRLLHSRRLTEDFRTENILVSDTFTVVKQGLSYCNLNPALVYAGFMFDVVMDNLEIPTQDNADTHEMEIKYEIARHLDLEDNLDAVRVYRMESCVEDDCSMLAGRRNLAINSIRYYVDIQDTEAAEQLQQDVYNNNEVFEDAVVTTMVVDHCDSDLMNIMNQYRIELGVLDDEDQTVEDSSVGLAFGLLLSSIVLLY